jgi:hypothetical protein
MQIGMKSMTRGVQGCCECCRCCGGAKGSGGVVVNFWKKKSERMFRQPISRSKGDHTRIVVLRYQISNAATER